MTLDELTALLKNHFPKNSLIECSGTLYHVTIRIVNKEFEGLSVLKRHQSIYRILNSLISNQTLHALTLITQTPQELNSLS